MGLTQPLAPASGIGSFSLAARKAAQKPIMKQAAIVQK